MREGRDGIRTPTAAVVGVGDELLYGVTADTNGSWLAGELSSLGLQVTRRWVVGDEEEEIQEVVARALAGVDLVVATGGLGPTPDDLTREAVAGLLGLPLGTDPVLLKGLEARFRARGYEVLPENTLAMAMAPEGSRILPNPRGAAPGLVLDAPHGKAVILLPGVPMEMRAIFREGVVPFLRERYGSRLEPVAHRVIHTTGIPESVLSQEVERVLPPEMGPVSLAYLPDVSGVRIRLSARGPQGDDEVEGWLRRMEELLDPVVGPYRYRAPGGDLAEAVGELLAQRGVTVAVAESCTGGIIAGRLTHHAGSSRYFLGGVVAYSDQVKMGVLGVEETLLRDRGAVSREVAEAMATGVARKLGARAGIGVTGVAGPGGGSADKPVGTVWYAAAFDGSVVAKKELFPGSREDVRRRAAQAALALLLHLLDGREG
ncbi:competence/damage-inducible protein A [Gemmatimonadota bacterium]